MAGMTVCRNEPERYRIVGRMLQFAAQKHALGLATGQNTQKRVRVIRHPSQGYNISSLSDWLQDDLFHRSILP